MPLSGRLSLSLLLLPSLLMACSSSPGGASTDGGTSSSSGPTFVVDGGVTFSVASSGVTGASTGPGFTTGTTGVTGASSGVVSTGPVTSGTATSVASSSTPLPSSGIVITVEPDGTGDAEGLLTAIQGAQVSVHMEMYLLTNSDYIDALESLSSKLDVKVLLNQTFPTGTTAAQTNASTYTALQGAGVNVKWAPADPDGSDTGYTHEKAVIIDPGTANAQVWIMTMNLDTDAPKYNREFLAQDTISADIAEAEQIFEADYAGTPATVSGDLLVAPVNATQGLLALAQSATTSIDIEAEEIDSSGVEEEVFNAITSKAQSGVKVRLVLEDSSEATQTAAVTALQQAGATVVGYAYGGSGLDIHAKTMVVDGTTAYIGSENFTGGSLGYNRELGVIFQEPSEIAKIQTAINADVAGGSAYMASSN